MASQPHSAKLTLEERVILLSKLSLDEKVSLLAAADWWRTPVIRRDGVFIPPIKMSDGPNGARGESYVSGIKAACFPCSTCIGATFDVEQAHRLGQEIARETKTKSANILLAPTMNVIRSPLGGRNYETYSEDPIVIGTFAAAFVNGCQAEGIAATPKHFVANDSEKRRTKMTANIDEQTLREIYMLPFQIALRDSDPWCIMTSYNKVNGEYCSDSARLLTDILRGEWGFSGTVISDWLGTYSTATAINAGLDLEMPGPTRWRGSKLVEAVSNGTVPVEAIDKSVDRVLDLASKIGRFQHPCEEPERSICSKSRWEWIADVAADGAVLLKNEDSVLPVKPGSSLAVIGQFATEPPIGGGGSAKVLAERIVSPLEALLEAGFECLHAPGVPVHATIPHADADILFNIEDLGDDDTRAVLLEWFSGSSIGLNRVHSERIVTPEYMIKEAWPQFLERDYCTRMSFLLAPKTSGDHTFSVITSGSARVFIDGVEVFHRPQEPVLQPESFYFYKAKIERRFTVHMKASEKVHIQVHSWAADEAVLDRVDGTVFQGSSLRFKEYIDINGAINYAAETARSVDTAIIFVGNTNEIESEGYDRETMDLTTDQYDLVSAVATANPRTVVVNFSGSPVTVSRFIDVVPSFLQAWFAGQECGYSVAKVLTGAVNPSGRLPMTWPVRNEDNPAYNNFPCDEADVCLYEEGLDIGYRYYDREDTPRPQFPFGFGLSYTTFELRGFRATKVVLGKPDTVKVTLITDVVNIGYRAGKCVVQVYVSRKCGANTGRPVKELKTYSKVFVDQGQQESLSLALDKYAFSWFDADCGCWKLQAGEYEILAGFSSEETPEHFQLTVAESHHWVGL